MPNAGFRVLRPRRECGFTSLRDFRTGPGAVLPGRLGPRAAEGAAERVDRGVADGPRDGQALDGIEAGQLEVVADEDTARAKADLSADPALTYAAQLTVPAGT